MYSRLAQLASHSAVLNGPYYNNDPLTYCLGDNMSQRFNHGGHADIYGQNSAPCQVFLAERCAKKWDNVCEYAYAPRTNEEYKIRANPIGKGASDLNSGEILLVNTAQKKYLWKMLNCEAITQPFDPMVPASPLITSWRGLYCKPLYAVNPASIDDDIVMNKILQKPWIAVALLQNIKNTMISRGDFKQLAGTKLGRLYGI